MKEKEWENLLRIKTTGRDDTRSDTFRYPYEPTSYMKYWKDWLIQDL